jgi:sterol desaturase/sphingolipid hydroxylase (fatty acid hydroxylase superfamily)
MHGLADTARQFLGANYEPARDFFWSIFALTERTTAVWMACYLLLALLVYARGERKPGEAFLAGFRRYLFPKEVYAHPSARADFVYFAVEKVLFFAALETLAVSGDLITVRLLQWFPVRSATAGGWWATGLMTLAAFLAFDLGAFVWHFLTHRVQVLWAFHRVHHSAEVLTPISNYREHPVDSLGRALVQGAFVGAAQAAVLHLAPWARPLEAWGLNAVYLPFFVFSNARHSHVWVGFGRFWSHVFNSPAQHQCHHGTAPEHIDVNYGLVLSLWDWLAGTLYVPLGREEVRYGLVGEQQPFPTVLSMYVRPFHDAWLRLTKRGAQERYRLSAAPSRA